MKSSGWFYLHIQLYTEHVVQSLSRVWLFAVPWTAAHQASQSFGTSWSLLRLCPLSRWCHPTISVGMSLSKLRGLVMDREAWCAVIHGVAKSRIRLSDWTQLNWCFLHCLLEWAWPGSSDVKKLGVEQHWENELPRLTKVSTWPERWQKKCLTVVDTFEQCYSVRHYLFVLHINHFFFLTIPGGRCHYEHHFSVKNIKV